MNWIKQSIKRALANQSKTIRLPVHIGDKISAMRRVAMKLQAEFGREPTGEELGQELGASARRLAHRAGCGRQEEPNGQQLLTTLGLLALGAMLVRYDRFSISLPG
jgi:hypothetical protein